MNPEYVILLHGLGRTRHSMNRLRKFLAAAGYTVVNVGYPSRKMAIESLADLYVAPVIQKYKGKNTKIHVVTHSMGGLLIRQYLQYEHLPVGSKIVMLAPPNKGSNVADKFKSCLLFKLILGQAGQQLTTKDGCFTRYLSPINEHIGIIAGTKNWLPGLSRLFSGENDGLVSVEQTKLDEMQGFITVPFAHTLIMNKTAVHHKVHQFIKSGKFENS